MRMAKAVASVRARSWAASGATAPSARAIASFQRSMKRRRCCSTSWGTRGVASAASLRSCAMRSSSMVARRLPSRARASSSSVRACSASVGSTLLQSTAELPLPLARRRASETDRLRASGSQDWTVSWSMARRCSMAVEGSGRELPSSLSMAARTSTLPRLRRAVKRARKAGSCARSSSGRRNERSRKRLLTERISRPSRLLRPDAPPSSSDAPCWALAYPVML